MSYRYDPAGMKSTAEAVEREMNTFNQARLHMDSIVASMSSNSWNDLTNQRFVRRYNSEAKEAMEKLYKEMLEIASFLKECSKRFGSAIDNGNSYLSE